MAIFILVVLVSYFGARVLNDRFERLTLGTSLDWAKEARLTGAESSDILGTSKRDVLVFGDSLLEILFEPLEFDADNSSEETPTQSWNLGIRSMTGSDFLRLASHLKRKSSRFEVCLVQIPTLHFFPQKSKFEVRSLWPGMGFTNFLNLLNPMSRLDHALDSPANIWTGPISRESLQWDHDRRGGRNFVSSPHFPEMHQSLKNPAIRRRIHAVYGEALRLKEYKADETDLAHFVDGVTLARSFCDRVRLIWPAFSSEFFDPQWSPQVEELQSIRKRVSERTGLPIEDFPMTLDDSKFLESQHIDPNFRGEFHKWLRSIVY